MIRKKPSLRCVRFTIGSYTITAVTGGTATEWIKIFEDANSVKQFELARSFCAVMRKYRDNIDIRLRLIDEILK